MSIAAHSSEESNPPSGSSPRNFPLEDGLTSANEHSPLLSASSSENGDDDEVANNAYETRSTQESNTYQDHKSVWYLMILVLSLGGLQIAWSVELSNGTPYLLSLGLDKSLMALVWIAGPLSGTLVQPYVGIRSDNCRVSWGKRKPFMIAGAAATILSLLALAWTREIVGNTLGFFGADRQSDGVKNTIIIVAVLFVYILDFAINTVQAAIRAFMVDCAPHHQQEAVNAMGSRITGIGNIIGYVFGYINLPKYLWFFGNTQFKVLCVIASIALGSTIIISVFIIKELDPRLEGPPQNEQKGMFAFFKGVFGSIRSLPPKTRKVCEVQFFAWICWFGFLFYQSTWVGDLYVQPFLEANPHLPPADIDALYEKATRVGTLALLVWAISTLTCNLLLPFLITPTYDAIFVDKDPSSKSPSDRLNRFLNRLTIPGLTLRRAWTLSLVLLGLCMFSTLLIRDTTTATILVALVGISWALTIWAPFAIISAEIAKRDALRRTATVRDSDDNGDQAGVVLGIHNVAIAAPQVIATLSSSAIFHFLQRPRGTPGDRSMPAVLAFGGIFAIVAAWVASRIPDEKAIVLPTSTRARSDT